ncbi:NAD-dependent glycerol-3-phosphate dehydrogenase domain protein [Rippkaea orientalis PCC 8801]|uniref:Glycerol-3-phosphate dehydrogenase [NAD(P)+] n=1 Tax=Rippkaea orientalis (strain PCC 8801 / RF-1) TaxID=41431 RepID=B7K616_RIPO1|nr:NAD(P)H-dependent glycerol-3-phosphate dehydrogenase [Rippkaea orientalis]ACK68069.1 NAD-dependent glycerol-3-phosphate dehydrogenase domain protein [Rippkaea orientalis PCC 8801]
MTHQLTNITIIGAGLWGLALAKLGNYNQHNQVTIWSRHSPDSLASIIGNTDVIVSAVSMPGVRPTIELLQSLNFPQNSIIVTATKGLDPITTDTPSQMWQAAFPEHSIVVLSGPNLSKEIDQGLPAATVVSSHNLAAAETIQERFSSEVFRVYVNSDPIGTELGGTLKNVMAIAAGVCDGLQLGTNAKAALVTRALPEMIRVGTYFGASPATFFGLSGLGDLMATCDSPLSRNYRVGYGLAQGKTLEEILLELKSTAEGINTTHVLVDLANKQGIVIPIAWEVERLLKGETTPQEAVQALIKRELKEEFGDLGFDRL